MIISETLSFATPVNVVRVVSKKGQQFVQSANQQEIIAGIVGSKDVMKKQECQKNASLVCIYLE